MIDDDAISDAIPYYGRDGRLITRKELDVLLADHDYRRVAHDHVNDVLISTLWLGVDYSFGRGPRRLIFETAMLGPEGAYAQELSSTEAEALAVHRRFVGEALDGL